MILSPEFCLIWRYTVLYNMLPHPLVQQVHKKLLVSYIGKWRVKNLSNTTTKLYAAEKVQQTHTFGYLY